jgi:hypothetical protein
MRFSLPPLSPLFSVIDSKFQSDITRIDFGSDLAGLSSPVNLILKPPFRATFLLSLLMGNIANYTRFPELYSKNYQEKQRQPALSQPRVAGPIGWRCPGSFSSGPFSARVYVRAL